MMNHFTPGQRVRYVGQATDRDVDATVVLRERCPADRVALLLKNGLVFFADPADCIALTAPLAWPMEFPESASL